jgi:Cdc6-like AAA superfamily ATPase
MEPEQTSSTIVFDRRQIYRPFLERLNPIASARTVLEQDLIVPPDHDPRDLEQPPIHVAFTRAAELNRGTQMALVGGIGSGKTTELMLTYKLLKRHTDAVNLFVDISEIADLRETNAGAILALIGMGLFSRLKKQGCEISAEVETANERLRKLAFPRTEWRSVEDRDEECYGTPSEPVHIRGLIQPRFAAILDEVAHVRDLLLDIAKPLTERGAQITVLIDGLDRLIQPERFREFAEQDLRALRDSKISVIVATPLLLWFDKSEFLHDFFDMVKHIPAAFADPEESDFLRRILERRGASDLMDESEMADISKYSGGVLRDLLTLARSAAEYAYGDDQDRIGPQHVRSAILQLGKRYLPGVGPTAKYLIERLMQKGYFSTDQPVARELLVHRQVLEYFRDGGDVFAVHPALAEVMGEPT